MKNIAILSITLIMGLSSCVSKKEFSRITKMHTDCQSELNACNDEKNKALAKVNSLEETNDLLKDQVKNLNNSNAALLNNVGNLATLSKKEAENLERSLESIKEKDMQIRTMRDAITKKDSVTLALVTSLKGALGNLNDEDIEINVEKGAVFISISDKMLFRSGSYQITDNAKAILGKVAKIINDKSDLEFIIEGHTDSVPIKLPGISDNWDLSVLRATSVARVLQNDFNVAPSRITAAGRSYYVPVADNKTAANRAKNRRTRIVVLPRLDQFFGLIEEGMKKAK